MSHHGGRFCDHVCQRVEQLAAGGCGGSTAAAVSAALVEARIDVAQVSLDDWKSLLFEAMRTARTHWGRGGSLAA